MNPKSEQEVGESQTTAVASEKSLMLGVPVDARESIVRHLSSRHHHVQWVSYIEHSYVEKVLLQGGPLREAMMRSVFGLALGDASFEVQKRNMARNGLLCTPLPQEVVKSILPQLTHFIVDLRGENALRAFDDGCPALLSLSLNFHEENDYLRHTLREVSTRARNLRRLELMGDKLGSEDIQALERFVGIQDLRLEVLTYESNLGQVWTNLGSGLRKLHIDDRVHPKLCVSPSGRVEPHERNPP